MPRSLPVLLTVLALAPILRGEDKPDAKENSAITVGEMRVQNVPAMTFLCVPAQTTFAKMGDPVKAGFDKVFGAASEAKLLIARPTMLLYQGNPHIDPQADKEFMLEIGIVVSDDTQAPAGCTVRKTAALKCATILYTGTVYRQGEAWQKLVPALRAAGHTPAGEEREMCLYWEGPDSPNNVFLMMLAVK